MKNTYTVIDPCYLDLPPEVYMDVFRKADGSGCPETGEKTLVGGVSARFIQTDGDGFHFGCDVDSGTLVVFEDSAPLQVKAYHKAYDFLTGLTSEEADALILLALANA